MLACTIYIWWLYDSGTICTNKVSGAHICFDYYVNNTYVLYSKNIFYILYICIQIKLCHFHYIKQYGTSRNYYNILGNDQLMLL